MMSKSIPGRPGAFPQPAATTDGEALFEELFLAHYDRVFRLLYSIVGSRQEAEDLAQETFLKLHKHRFDAGRQHNVPAWLFKVATNLAYNTLRGEKRREQRQESAGQAMLRSGSAPDPAQVALREAERATVRRVLAGLPERQARLLLLRHAGLSYQELADALDVAPSSVGTMLARAHAAFEAAFQREAAGPGQPKPESSRVPVCHESERGKDHGH